MLGKERRQKQLASKMHIKELEQQMDSEVDLMLCSPKPSEKGGGFAKELEEEKSKGPGRRKPVLRNNFPCDSAHRAKPKEYIHQPC